MQHSNPQIRLVLPHHVVAIVRLVIAKTLYSGHNAKLGQVFAVRHPGGERGAKSPIAGRVVYNSYALRACTKFSVWCDGAEMNTQYRRRRAPARVASPAAVTYQEKTIFLLLQLVTRYMTR
jgi:hypothetical protein